MPGSGGRFGVNDPPPAAITTTLHLKVLPRSVVSLKPPPSSRPRLSTRWLK
jgi:hypothetical protein